MGLKSIESVIAPQPAHYVGDGFRVHNFIPGSGALSMERMSPFIMLDYNARFYFPPSDKPRGVGVHPHRGFETVTIAYQGKVAHGDSAGNSGIIHEGDVQWMTAASGILHKEYHEENFSRSGGDFQMVQLWINLPAKDKMSPPKYQNLTNDSIPKVALPDGGGMVEIIAGEFQGRKGAAYTFTPVHLQNVKLRAGGHAGFSFPAAFNTAALLVEGTAHINGQEIKTDHFALFKNEGEDFTVQSEDGATLLILSGAPIHEPVAAHGPFVMNTRDELIQAIDDFNSGKFGLLED